jgi:hypothetical protein
LAYKLKINESGKSPLNEYINPELSSACFDMKTVTPLLKVDTLKLVYFISNPSSRMDLSSGNSTDSKKSIYHPKEKSLK